MSFALKLEILRLLKESKPYMMPEPAVLNQLAVRVRPPVTPTEIREVIKDLETNHRIVGITGEDGVARYKITAAGEATIAEAEFC